MNELVDNNIIQYLNDCKSKLKQFDLDRKNINKIDKFPLMKGQAIYICDYTVGDVTYTNGVEDLLGYTFDEFNFKLITSYFHPNEIERIRAIAKAALEFGFNNHVSMLDCKLFITCQIKLKDNTYKWFLRQSAPLETTSKGEMISNVNLLTDITFMNPTGIRWLIDGDNLDREDFNQKVRAANRQLFSAREIEILGEITNGSTSKKISEKLHISKHTVDTHRRNILRKSGATNLVELIDFVQTNNILLNEIN